MGIRSNPSSGAERAVTPEAVARRPAGRAVAQLPGAQGSLHHLTPAAVAVRQRGAGNRTTVRALGLAAPGPGPGAARARAAAQVAARSDVAVLRSTSAPPESIGPILEPYEGRRLDKVGQVSAPATQYAVAATTGVNVRARPDGSLPHIAKIRFGTEIQARSLDTTGAFGRQWWHPERSRRLHLRRAAREGAGVPRRGPLGRDMTDPRTSTDLGRLRPVLDEMVGLTLLAVWPSYGGELQLHIGTALEISSRSGLLRGQWVLGTRASAWEAVLPGGAAENPADDEDLAVARSLEGRRLTRIEIPAGRPDLELGFDGGGVFRVLADRDEADLAAWELTTPGRSLVSVGPGAVWRRSWWAILGSNQ